MTVSFSKDGILYCLLGLFSDWVGGSTNGFQEGHAQRCPVWKGDFGVGSSVGAALAEQSYYRGIVRDEAIQSVVISTIRSSCEAMWPFNGSPGCLCGKEGKWLLVVETQRCPRA